MSRHPVSRLYARLAPALLALIVIPFAAPAQTPGGGPVLLTEGTGTTTRAVAFDSVTFAPEPFAVTSVFDWTVERQGRDMRTRVTLFAMNLDLLAGEGANALTADAEDASGRIYPLKVEYVGRPVYVELRPAPGNPAIRVPQEVPQHWLYAVVVRLHDEMTDQTGDVLVRISLHGNSSNRARIAVGRTGGGPPTDPATELISPAPAATPAPTPTPTPKAFGPNEASEADVVRLLEQATWGPTSAEVQRVRAMGLRAFVEEQFNAPVANPAKGSNYPDLEFPPDDQQQGCPSGSPPECSRDKYSIYPVQKTFFASALSGQSQLRQRVAFALHQVMVVSGRDITRPSWMTVYLQLLDRNAFGNYRTLLEELTLNPAMGEYLDMRRSTRTNPNENYAREILQLFSVGVNEMNPDGTPRLDSDGNPVPTYTQEHVNEFTRVLTGWNFQTAIAAGVTNYRDPMVPRGGTTHDTGAKTLLGGQQVAACAGTNADCARSDLAAALDNIFNHPNVGPFVAKHLIQHLVTSNPSPAYVGRVASAFDNDCAGLYPESPCSNARGNLRAVVRNILLDPEARGDRKTDPNYGRLREPVQYLTNILRAFNATSDGVLGNRSSGGDLPNLLDQPVFQPPTVFSYYPPDYEVPGTKLLGPAFGILSTSTTLRRANVANQLIYTGIAAGANNPTGTQLNLSSLEALAAADQTGGQLVEELNRLLLHAAMSAQTRAAVLTAVQAIPTSDAAFARKRAQTAAYLVVTSSQFDVQR
jgi:uncharacterized protein (DUF1800 family)